MWHQCQHHDNPLLKGNLLYICHLFHPAVGGWGNLFQCGIFTLLLEIVLYGNCQYLIKPTDIFVHPFLSYKLLAFAPIMSASCSKPVLSLTGIPLTSVVGSTRPAICWATCQASWGKCCSCPGATWISVPCV